MLPAPLLFALSLCSLVGIGSAQAIAQAVAPADESDPTARVIVKYKADSRLLRKDSPTVSAQIVSQVAALGARVGLTLGVGAVVAERTHVVVASGLTSQQLAARLAAESDIEYAVPDERRHHLSVPNDPLYLEGPPVIAGAGGPVSGQWYLRPSSGSVQSSINVEPAWDVAGDGAMIVVASIDTGVRPDHPDLMPVASGGVFLPGYDMISDLTTANDGGGRDGDASDPGDWVSQADIVGGGRFASCGIENSSWHGTQTSGLIGALANNGIGMAGVARNVRILPVRVLGKCGGFDSDIIAGMRWAAGLSVPGLPTNPNPARVLNMSLGGDGLCSGAYADAISQVKATGAIIVVAAGNASGHAVGTPANCAGVIAVGGLRHVGTKVGFSSIGREVAISAPGGNCVNTGPNDPCLYPILTTANSGQTMPITDETGPIYTGSFRPSVGTSFSTPLVAGTVALMLSVQPTLTHEQVVTYLQATARRFPSSGVFNTDGTPLVPCAVPRPITSPQIDQLECYCTASTCGAGMLDAGRALMALTGALTPAVMKVTEFYHPQFDHYFMTADAAEAASLAAGNLPPWVATGLTFDVWDGPGTNIINVCRFFSNSFGFLSSHFYSNNASECPGLQNAGVWTLESFSAFYMMRSGDGTCPADTIALYRLYNNGQGGAPNHRYTTDPAVRAVMIARNWSPEGNGNDGVFACVPA